eukprot:2256356-Amphidinium_carterae.2
MSESVTSLDMTIARMTSSILVSQAPASSDSCSPLYWRLCMNSAIMEEWRLELEKPSMPCMRDCSHGSQLRAPTLLTISCHFDHACLTAFLICSPPLNHEKVWSSKRSDDSRSSPSLHAEMSCENKRVARVLADHLQSLVKNTSNLLGEIPCAVWGLMLLAFARFRSAQLNHLANRLADPVIRLLPG